jgi:excisionase family DNA binding protein
MQHNAASNQRKTTPGSANLRENRSANRATFTVLELASHLGISEPVVYRMLKRGEIPRRLAGKRYIIPRAAVEDWLRATPTTQGRRAE